jgi:hypothetical protein
MIEQKQVDHQCGHDIRRRQQESPHSPPHQPIFVTHDPADIPELISYPFNIGFG